MATVTNVAQLNGLFKEVYASSVQNLIPENSILQKKIPFNNREKIGSAYHQPVKLTASQGFTYATADAGAFALNSAVALTTKDAIVRGSQMVLRDQLSYDAAAKASHGGTKSFVDATRYLVDSMVETTAKRVEIALMYGGSGLGKGATSTNIDATNTSVVITKADWSIGIWSGLENTILQAYISDTSDVASGADGLFSITSMEVDTRTINFSGTAAGITALDAAILANANDVDFYFQGAKGNEMSGLDKIITNTGTLFNIDASAYNLWRGNVHAIAGSLTLADVYDATARAVGRGLNEDVTCLVSPDTWKDLNNDASALRVYDSNYNSSMAENGFKAIEYYGANGMVSILSHTIVKAGEAFIIPTKRFKRVGASDVRFQSFTNDNDNFFRELSDNAGYELRNYTDQAIFCECPAKTVKIKGIVNS